MTGNGRAGEDGSEEQERSSVTDAEERTIEEWAKYAARKADSAANHALEAHAAVGKLAGDMSRLKGAVEGLTTEVRDGFEKLDQVEGKVRKHQRSLSDLHEVMGDDPADTTQIRDLKGVVKTLEEERQTVIKRNKDLRKAIVGIVTSAVALIIAGIVMRFVFHV